MNDTKASPISGESWGAVTKELADILLRYRNDVKHERDVISFLSRIVDETAPDPALRYICVACCQWTGGDDGRFIGEHHDFICNWCLVREAANEVKP